MKKELDRMVDYLVCLFYFTMINFIFFRFQFNSLFSLSLTITLVLLLSYTLDEAHKDVRHDCMNILMYILQVNVIKRKKSNRES